MIDTTKFSALLKKHIAILELELELKKELETLLGDSGEKDMEAAMKSPELINLSIRVGELNIELEK